jgi:hypothetical protein
MQQDYLAAPELWAAAEKWGANTMDMANCLLELRARVEALEGLHSYKIGEAEPIEDWGKGHTLVNPKPPSLKEQALEALGPEPMPETGPTGDTILNVGAIERHRFLRRALEALDD